MDDKRAAPLSAVVLTFNPGIKGIRRPFKVRAVQWRGDLWLVAKDAAAAAGWHPDTFRHRREKALTGDDWGYATMPTAHGPHMMTLVPLPALRDMMRGSPARQVRAFCRWLSAQEVGYRDYLTSSSPLTGGHFLTSA